MLISASELYAGMGLLRREDQTMDIFLTEMCQRIIKISFLLIPEKEDDGLMALMQQDNI